MSRLFLQFISLVIVFLSSFILAQNDPIQGIYKTAFDFRFNHLTFTEVSGKRYRFQSENLFNTSNIKITIGDSVFKIRKDSIFGYRSIKCYRIYNKIDYEILNPNEEIMLYTKTVLTGFKSNQQTKYFFSISPGAEIYDLTIYNLKSVTRGDTLFHDQLDLFFRYDTDLLEYDPFYKSYKINRHCKIKQPINNK